MAAFASHSGRALNVMLLAICSVSILFQLSLAAGYISRSAHLNEVTTKKLCVRPTNNESCVCTSTHQCNTLANYTVHFDNSSSNDASYTTFLFMIGTHIMEADVIVNITGHNVTLIAQNDTCVNPTIQCQSKGGFEFHNVTNLQIERLTFTNCGYVQIGYEYPTMFVLRINIAIHVSLTRVTVMNSTGFGLLAQRVYGQSKIEECLFEHNSGTNEYIGGNAAITFAYCSKEDIPSTNLTIMSSTFRYGRYAQNSTAVFASGLVLYMNCSNVSIVVNNITLIGNTAVNNYTGGEKAHGGANMAILFYNFTSATANSVQINKSKFIDGTALLGGGLFVNYFIDSWPEFCNSSSNTYNRSCKCNNELTITNSMFDGNHALENGGALYFDYSQGVSNITCNADFTVQNCSFTNNSVLAKNSVGVAICINNYYINGVFQQTFKYNHFLALIEDCSFKGNYLLDKSGLFGAQHNNEGAVVHISEQEGKVSIANSHFKSNDVTAISAFRSSVRFRGNVNITNNTGYNGGGILLCEASYIVLTPNVTLTIADNHALNAGGGIFSGAQCLQSTPLCFFMIDPETHHKFDNLTEILEKISFKVFLTNNTAAFAGTQIYGGALDTCYLPYQYKTKGLIAFNKIFNYTHNQSDLSAITSDPDQVCFCNKTENQVEPDCNIAKWSVDVYPGQPFNHITFVTVGQMNGAVPGKVKATVDSSHSTTTKLEFKRSSVNRSCTSLNLTAYSNAPSANITLTVDNINSNPFVSKPDAKTIAVTFKPCPLGMEVYAKVKDTTGPFCKCVKEPMLYAKGFICHVKHKSGPVIIRPPPKWIGYHFANKSTIPGTINGVIYHSLCPFDYCLPRSVKIHTSTETLNQDAQCANNRLGILCGACRESLSVTLGSSSACLDCSRKGYPSLIGKLLLLALVGILVVILLIVFNLTITECTISGLLFYANIFYSSRPEYFIQSKASSVKIQSNFFQNILVYLISWLNLDSGINYCFYNGMTTYDKAWICFAFPVYLWLIAITIIYISRRCARFARIVGENGVQVLATLFLLSYTRINEAVISTLWFTTLSYPGPNGTHIESLVWLYDANVPYLRGKHIPLFVMGVVFGILSLSYTLVLLFIQPLQRHSHRKCFKWVAKLKPFVDAYTSPHNIKEHNQFWNGLLLFARIFLDLFYVFSVNKDSSIYLTAIILTCLCLLTTAWSVGGVYKKWQLNVLSSFFILNLAMLCTIMMYLHKANKYTIINAHSHQERHQMSVRSYYVNTSLCSAMIVFIGVVTFHMYKSVKRWQCIQRVGNCCGNQLRRYTHPRILQHIASFTQANGDHENAVQDVERVNEASRLIPSYREPLLSS